MPRVTFINHEGETADIEADIGQSLMHIARGAGVDGIVGECGGCCACGTCHVTIAPEWRAEVGPPGSDEDDMLDFVRDRQPASRLSCQIRMRAGLDGLVVHTPARQG